jgi:DNA-binding transcriptional MerR regulator
MLKIGNFSRIAYVSVRLLHYYEELGLFTPAYIEPATGYRYYKTSQIKDLNKILALKDLGLSLQEIRGIMQESISPEELRGMLRLKKSQLLQSLEEELLRLRRIEYRLKQLDEEPEIADMNVLIKTVPSQAILSTRNRALPVTEFRAFVGHVLGSLASQDIAFPGTLTILEHSETFPDDYFDLEIGFVLTDEHVLPANEIVLSDNSRLALHELPAANQMASLLHVGAWGTGLRSYRALGQWIESHGFEIIGATREVYLEYAKNETEANVVEFQLPTKSTGRIALP